MYASIKILLKIKAMLTDPLSPAKIFIINIMLQNGDFMMRRYFGSVQVSWKNGNIAKRIITRLWRSCGKKGILSLTEVLDVCQYFQTNKSVEYIITLYWNISYWILNWIKYNILHCIWDSMSRKIYSVVVPN